jgi:hypothetical protein
MVDTIAWIQVSFNVFKTENVTVTVIFIQALVSASKPIEQSTGAAKISDNSSITSAGSAGAPARRVRRSILSSVIAAVKDRTHVGGSNPQPQTQQPIGRDRSPSIVNGASSLSLPPATPASATKARHPIPDASNSPGSGVLMPQQFSATSSNRSVKTDIDDDSSELFYRLQIFGVSLAVVALGWYLKGFYGAATAIGICIMAIIIAYVPV